MEKQFDQIPEHLKPKNVGTDALFKGSFLEKLTRTHISIPVTMHLIIVAFFVYMSWADVFAGIPGIEFTVQGYIGLFFAGYITWTLSEYWVHRIVYHIHTKNKVLLKIQHMGHGIHHQYPKDPNETGHATGAGLDSNFHILWYFLVDNAELCFCFLSRFLIGICSLYFYSLYGALVQTAGISALKQTMEMACFASL